ncbi:T9SS type A sorting domain-containing protein [Flavobacterium sp. UBA4854]|uniref:T9SS type A sorting domain-containing protein n=1 Tax=Flavobacterium sp. UBA4854 TaxID=1946548 RepID=UPI00257C47FA|nr:T9SS type A sorting domain-containing protein [Flavobacterium sp. UBA4854]
MKRKVLLFFLMLCVFTQTNAQQKIYDLSSYASNFVNVNDRFMFESSTADAGREIWQSDGTTSNTKLIKDIYPGSGSSVIETLRTGAMMNNNYYFIAKDKSSTGEIWKTDGTEAGTTKITSFLNGRVLKLTTVGNSIYFLLKTEENVMQVWKTDGTTAGTVIVKDNVSIWNEPTFEGKCNNTFIFTFQPYLSDMSRVWRSDGTADGTYPITEEMDGNGSGSGGTPALSHYIENDNKLYFVSRYYLYSTDGTVGNTKIVSNVWDAHTDLVFYGNVIKADNSLYFMFWNHEILTMQIWKYNLTNNQTSIVYEGYGQKYFFPSNLIQADNSLLFCGPNNTGGTSLLSMDLSTNAITNLKELTPSAVQPFIFNEIFDTATIFKINNNDYFINTASEEPLHKRKGWILNKSSQSIENVAALDNFWDGIVYKDFLYYVKDNTLWKYASNLNTIVYDKREFVTVFPNPSSDFVQIGSNDENSIESVQLFDLNGRLVDALSDYQKNRVDVSRLSSGVYNMKIKFSGVSSVINKKIIKK